MKGTKLPAGSLAATHSHPGTHEATMCSVCASRGRCGPSCRRLSYSPRLRFPTPSLERGLGGASSKIKFVVFRPLGP
jgi:hypothetical protein